MGAENFGWLIPRMVAVFRTALPRLPRVPSPRWGHVVPARPTHPRPRRGYVLIVAAGALACALGWLAITGALARADLKRAAADAASLQNQVAAGDVAAATA